MPIQFAHHGATTVFCSRVILFIPFAPKASEPSLIANPSSPEPRTKLLNAVRLLPVSLFVPPLPLFRLMPSAQVLLMRLFCTVPFVPSAQTPAPSCWIQRLSMSHPLPLMLIAPPLPPTTVSLTALPSIAKFFMVTDVGR